MKYFIATGMCLFLLLMTGCQKKEMNLLDDLNQKLKLADGKVEKAKEIVKQFMEEQKIQIQEVVDSLSAMPVKTEEQEIERAERLAEFNNRFYDKNGLHNTIAVFEKDQEFREIFDRFKKAMQGFFQDF